MSGRTKLGFLVVGAALLLSGATVFFLSGSATSFVVGLLLIAAGARALFISQTTD